MTNNTRCDTILNIKNCDFNLIDGVNEILGSRVKKIILYGSYARGDYDYESDIDIMILVDMMPEELVKHRRIFNDFSTDIDLNYNVVLSSKLQSKQFFNEWKNTLTFYQNVIKDGVIYA